MSVSKLTEKQIDIPAELQQRIADVRDNSTPTDWVLASLSAESEGAAALRVVGSGSSGVRVHREAAGVGDGQANGWEQGAAGEALAARPLATS